MFAVISFLVIDNLDISNRRWMQLNLLFSWRPYLIQRYYIKYGINILGNNVDKSLLGTLDNAYLALLIQYGLLTLLLYGIAFTIISSYAKKRDNLQTAIIVIGYEVFFLVEFVPLLININVIMVEFLILFFSLFESEGKDKKIEAYGQWGYD